VNPAGFGLQQRDRRFSSYEDLEARYELRPSAWVEPKGKWGAGRIELVELPTPDETNDNIVAFFVPETMPGLHQPYEFEYRLLWQRDAETHPPSSWVTQTRRGHGYVRTPDDTLSFVVDFEGPALKKLAADARLDPVVTADANADVVEANAYRNDVNGGARLAVRIRRHDDSKPVELRAFLRSGTTTLSETWSHILPPG
jgi:glucans biosynthesis protein